MADISKIRINSTDYNVKDKKLRDAEECPVTALANDIPSTWVTAGTGFYAISTSGLLVDQPAQYGFIFNYVNSWEDSGVSGANVGQIFLDYYAGRVYQRGGATNSGSQTDGWGSTWQSYYTDDRSHYYKSYAMRGVGVATSTSSLTIIFPLVNPDGTTPDVTSVSASVVGVSGISAAVDTARTSGDSVAFTLTKNSGYTANRVYICLVNFTLSKSNS